ncbi:MAG: hypothetical protein FWE06_04590 [Oscillospiraceae bacterium]|nr:hypothetical protein [Oscillospiraceae bacterium]
MTTKERFTRIINRQDVDRIPIKDWPWPGTVQRWEQEGLPAGMDYRDYFGIDKVQELWVDISPRYEVEVIEKTDEYTICTNAWGATYKDFGGGESTPEFLDFKVKDSKIWQETKARMTVDPSRIDWAALEDNHAKWVANGDWIEAVFWFGFDVAHSWMSGTETILMAMIEEPEWVEDIINTYLDKCIAHYDMMWDKGYRFDSIHWPDDMGYKGTTLFSPEIYRQIIKPAHKRAVDWAHNKGIVARLHSCGNITKLLPDIVDTGVDILNPLEVKAGMDALAVKAEYGDKLTLHGGLDIKLWTNPEAVVAEIERLVPKLKEGGGYIFASDHSIPSSVSLENMRVVVEAAKRVGTY